MYITQLAYLKVENVYAEEFAVRQTTPTDGGGRFLFYEWNIR